MLLSYVIVVNVQDW